MSASPQPLIPDDSHSNDALPSDQLLRTRTEYHRRGSSAGASVDGAEDLLSSTSSTASSSIFSRFSASSSTSALRNSTRSSNGDDDTMDDEQKYCAQKQEFLEMLLQEDPVNMADIRDCCLNRHGLVRNSLRARIWPKLLGISGSDLRTTSTAAAASTAATATDAPAVVVSLADDADNDGDDSESDDIKQLRNSSISRHDHYDQVQKDVERSMHKFTRQMSELEREYKRKQLARLMNQLLSLPASSVIGEPVKLRIRSPHSRTASTSSTTTSPSAAMDFASEAAAAAALQQSIATASSSRSERGLFYFQGFHDICTVFLLVCGECISEPCLERMARYYLRDSMHTERLEPILSVLQLIHVLMLQIDHELAKFMEDAGVQDCHYALSWVLTWFAHVVEDLDVIARLFDAFLASHPLLPMYLSAAIIMYLRDEILALTCEFSAVFGFLNKVPEQRHLPYEDLLCTALQLMDRYAPNELISISGIKFDEKSAFVVYPFDFLSSTVIRPDLIKLRQRKPKGSQKQLRDVYKSKFAIAPHHLEEAKKQQRTVQQWKRVGLVLLSLGVSTLAYYALHAT